MSEQKEIIAFKGFDENFKCIDYQYEVGQTYKIEGDVVMCENGFHSCTNPFDVLNYYDITSRFATVALSGDLKTHDSDSKIASAEITIKAELKLPEFLSTCISWLQEQCKGKFESGYYAKIGSSGDYAQIGSSGYSAQIGSSGDYAKIGSSGDYAKIGSSGDSAQIGSSGYSAQIGSSGYYAKIGSSGDYAKIGSSGYYAKIGSSGYYAKIGSSGDYAKIGSSGDSAKIDAVGESGVIASAGINTKVKGGVNCAIALTRWVESEKRYRITVAYVGENGIKENTWYKLNDNGEFVEAD